MSSLVGMGPAASPLEVVKRYVANFERKQRNLAKRKSKLDQYRERLAKGESLQEEQRKAVEDYDCVVQNISMLHEVISHSKELVDDVEEAVKYEESQIQLAHEQHTLSFLHMHLCLMRLLNALDSNDVRLAILRSTSENHLKMLDAVRNLVTAPVLDNWPGTTAAGLSSAPAYISDHPEVNSAAVHAYHLATGRPTPIPTPANYDGPPKKLNFKEARSLCLRLLATPAVIRSLGQRSRTCSSTSAPEDHKLDQTVESAGLPNVTHAVFCDGSHIRNEEQTTYVDANLHAPLHNHEQVNGVQVPVILDQVIKPLGGTFNFLQASSITTTDPMSGPSHPLVPKCPAGDIKPSSHFTNVLTTEEDTEHPTPVSNDHCPPPPHEHNIAVEELDLKPDTTNELHTFHVDDSLGSHLKAEPSVLEPSKPVSYADLVRRLSHARPPVNVRGRAVDAVPEARQSKGPPRQSGTASSVDHEDESQVTCDTPFMSPPLYNRNANDSRGGRMVGRPPMRGTYNGPMRRPMGGGSRPIRFGGTSARAGGTSFRGASTGVAQPSY